MKKVNFLKEFLLAGGIQSHDDPTPPADPPADPTPLADPTPPADPGKTFSQEDVNNLIAKNNKSATEKLLKDLGIEDFKGAKDGLKKLKEWQDSQKTDVEKLTSDLEAMTNGSSEKDKLIAEYKAKEVAYGKGVIDPKNQAKVIKLASVSDIEDMGEAIDAIIAEYPMFVGKDDPGKFGAGSKGSGAAGSTEMRDSIRKSMGLK